MIKLREEANKTVINMFQRQDMELAAIRAASREVTDKKGLSTFRLKCHAAIVKSLFEADPIINSNGVDYYIEPFMGGATIATEPHAPAIKTFQKKRVIQMPVRVTPVGDLSGKYAYIDLFDILEGTAAIVETADDALVNNINDIIQEYKAAFERVNFGAEAAGNRRVANRRDRVNAEIDDALSAANINEDDIYWSIGWLAKNITSIKAEIPNTSAARHSLEQEYPMLKDIPDSELASYYGVNRGSAKNRWDKSTQITISKKTEMPQPVKDYLETISLHRSTVDEHGISSNVAAIKLRDLGFTLGPNDPDRVKDFCYNLLKDQPAQWDNFMAGFNGLRSAPEATKFDPEMEATVNPLNQEF